MAMYIKGYNLTDFFAGKIRITYGKVEEVGSNYVIAKGALSHTGEQNWYTNAHSNGWLEFRPLNPIPLKGGKTYTLSFDITLLETIDGKTSFTAAASNFGGSNIYILKNTLDRQHVVIKKTFKSDSELSNTENPFYITLNSLHVKIENIILVEGNEEKPYDNGRIQVKPVIPVRNPKNLVDVSKMVNQHFTIDENGICTMTRTSKDGRFSGAFTFPEPLPAGKYTISCDLVYYTGTYNFWLQFVHTGGQNGLYKGTTKKTITFTQPVKSIQFYADGQHEIGSYYQFKNFMFNAGEIAEPYLAPQKLAIAQGVRNEENLIPFPYKGSVNEKDLTTVSPNGVITINGTSTALGNFFVTKQTILEPKKTYTLSGGKDKTCYLVAVNYKSDGSSVYSSDYGTGITFTTPEDYVYSSIGVYTPVGTEYDNVMVKPVLNLGETAEPYFVPQKI